MTLLHEPPIFYERIKLGEVMKRFLLSFFRRVRKIEKKRLLVSPCLSVCPHGTAGLLLDGFSWNLIWLFFENI